MENPLLSDVFIKQGYARRQLSDTLEIGGTVHGKVAIDYPKTLNLWRCDYVGSLPDTFIKAKSIM